jgi:hypothetical protein
MSTTANEIEARDGLIVGPLRRSVNNASAVAGSIHDDATATRLGFRGGTVAGSIHMELFPPLLLRAFGARWFERGTLSLYFVNATTDREAVRAFVREPPPAARDAQVEVWIEREDGMRVAEGTASVGEPGEKTALATRDLTRFAEGEYRILAGVRPGASLGEHKGSIARADQDARRELTTDPLDWYFGESPWGGSVLTPTTAVQLLYRQPAAVLGAGAGRVVGLFGAIELRHVNGPLRVDREYQITGEVIALGQSPRTEYAWFESAADDEPGVRVAELRMLLRYMKGSSERWSGESGRR